MHDNLIKSMCVRYVNSLKEVLHTCKDVVFVNFFLMAVMDNINNISISSEMDLITFLPSLIFRIARISSLPYRRLSND